MHIRSLLLLAAVAAAAFPAPTTAHAQPEPAEPELSQDNFGDTANRATENIGTSSTSDTAPASPRLPPPSVADPAVLSETAPTDAALSDEAAPPGDPAGVGGLALPPETPLASETASPEAPPPPLPFKGFEIAAGTDQRLKLAALLQADGRFLFGDRGTDTFAVRRARLDLRATLTSYLSARLHADLAGSRLNLLDAYVNLAFIPELQLQVGKMKAPIGLELLQSTRDIAFPERGLPSLLVPNRDLGAMVLGTLFDGAVSYAGGAFNGVADGSNGEEDENQPFDVAARLFLHPFAPLGVEGLSGLGLGIAGSWGEQEGALPAHRTPGRQTLFNYADGVTADGSRTRIAPQGYYYYGPVGLLAEWVHSEQWVTLDDEDRVQVDSTAWQLVASVVVGGKAGYKGATPESALDLQAGTWGAVELAGRYGQWEIDDDVFTRALSDPSSAPQAASSFGFSAAWWLFAGSRVLVAFDHTTFDFSDASNRREPESVLITRLQTAL